jgi:hypothetical protein
MQSLTAVPVLYRIQMVSVIIPGPELATTIIYLFDYYLSISHVGG